MCIASRLARWVAGTLTVFAIACPDGSAPAAETLAPGMYALTTETVMPHLEENLRYAITHARRCLRGQDLGLAFPVLEHPALLGCRLDEQQRSGDAVSYALICTGKHGTTGAAHWQLGARTARGTLEVKLGGKNMTFLQRVTAEALGPCTDTPNVSGRKPLIPGNEIQPGFDN